MDRFADKMAKLQTGLFLNLFYVTAVPIAAIYLRLTRRLHHKREGYFSEQKSSTNSLTKLKRQF